MKRDRLELPANQCSHSHLWSWILDIDGKDKIPDTSGQNYVAELHMEARAYFTDASLWKSPRHVPPGQRPRIRRRDCGSLRAPQYLPERAEVREVWAFLPWLLPVRISQRQIQPTMQKTNKKKILCGPVQNKLLACKKLRKLVGFLHTENLEEPWRGEQLAELYAASVIRASLPAAPRSRWGNRAEQLQLKTIMSIRIDPDTASTSWLRINGWRGDELRRDFESSLFYLLLSPLDGFPLNNLCEAVSCDPVTCTYYMVWQGKYSSSTCGCRSCSFSSFPDIFS